MQTKNCHHSEHISFPAHKMIEKGVLKKKRVYALTQEQKKLIKKNHRKRSRTYLKNEIRGADERTDTN